MNRVMLFQGKDYSRLKSLPLSRACTRLFSWSGTEFVKAIIASYAAPRMRSVSGSEKNYESNVASTV